MCSLVTMAREAMMKREVVNDPMVYESPCASFEDDALAVLLAKVREMDKMALVNSHKSSWYVAII